MPDALSASYRSKPLTNLQNECGLYFPVSISLFPAFWGDLNMLINAPKFI